MDPSSFSRRNFMRLGAATVAVAGSQTASQSQHAQATDPAAGSAGPPARRPFITPQAGFVDVSRGNPKPHQHPPEKLREVGLAADTWRLEITADPFVEAPHTKVPAALEKPLTIADGTALDFAGLMELAREHEVHYFKAMQCLNIETPLGQGLWTGVPLRTVLQQCGKMSNVRRIYYWGYHNE